MLGNMYFAYFAATSAFVSFSSFFCVMGLSYRQAAARATPHSRLVQNRVHVLGDGQVAARAADLEDAPPFACERAVDRDPDGLDEEVLSQDHRHQALVLADPPARAPEVREAVVERLARARDV